MRHIILYENYNANVDYLKDLIVNFEYHSIKVGDEQTDTVIRFNTLGDMDKCEAYLNNLGINTYVDDTNALLIIREKDIYVTK